VQLKKLKKSPFIPIIVLLAALLVVSASCTCWFGGERYSIQAMESVPVNSTTFMFWDINEMERDEDLWDIYAQYRNSQEVAQLRDLGLVLSAINYQARASGFSQADVIAGDFDLDAIRDKLEAQGFIENTYRGSVEVWTLLNTQPYETLALMDGTIIAGLEANVHKCIDVIKDENERSLFNDENARAVVDLLPEGITMRINNNTAASYDGLLAYGTSYEKESADLLRIRAIYKFEDEYTAGQALQGIENDLGQKDFYDIKVKRFAQFVEAEAKIDISGFSFFDPS